MSKEFAELIAFKNWLIKTKNIGKTKHRDLFVEYLEDTVIETQQDVDDRIATLKEALKEGHNDDWSSIKNSLEIVR